MRWSLTASFFWVVALVGETNSLDVFGGRDFEQASPSGREHFSLRTTRGLQDSSDATAVCPSRSDPLAREVLPVLTTRCPQQCAADNLCIYFPPNATGDCATSGGRSCFLGSENSCAFECIARPGGDDGWFLSLYTDDEIVNEVREWNVQTPTYQALAVNATNLRGFVGSLDSTIKTKHVYIVGQEAANNFNEEDLYYDNDDKPVSREDILPFDIPAKFYESLQMVSEFKLENIRFDAPPSNVSLSFPMLRELYLRNAMVTAVPFVNASIPALQLLDLSMNALKDVQQLPHSALIFVNLSFNAITSLPLDLFPPTTQFIDISSNPLVDIPLGTFPPSLKVLALSNANLTELPPDLASLPSLQRLTIDDNNLRTIPNDSIAVGEMIYFHATNCSLTAIPPIIKFMEKLTNIYFDYNDLSGDQDFSVLPLSVKFIAMQFCKLQKLPTDLLKLENLVAIRLAGNPQVMNDLANLPTSILGIFMSDNDLKAIPSGIRALPNLVTLDMLRNPVEKISPGDLPETLIDFLLTDAKFRALEPNTLPPSLRLLGLGFSLLEQAPEDIRSMKELADLTVSQSKLQSFDVANELPVLQYLDIQGNQIQNFSGSYPALVSLNLRNNSLQEFTVTSAPNLTTLYLDDNNLSFVPKAIFNFAQLQYLNLRGNPIRNFAPSPEQLAFLQKMPIVIMEQTMFANDCGEPDAARLAQFTVCKSSSQEDSDAAIKPSRNKKVSLGLILGNVGLGLVLIALGLLWWWRHKQQKMREKDLKSQTASLEEQLLDESIWTDPALLHQRLDASLVKRTRLLGSGVGGEVWLASYGKDVVALKMLKNMDEMVVQQFVSEIKLVLAMSHPRIVETVGVLWTKESDLTLVMEYMAGGDLRSHLDKTLRSTQTGWTPHMLQLALEITEAVVYLHSLDPIVIHRDLKSRNVLLDGDAHAKISDFGISRLMVDDETMTADVGTMRWMAPEVLAGDRYDESADIYSLGIILCEIDTHKLPFDGAMDDNGTQLLSDSAIATRLLSGLLTCTVSEACPLEIRHLVEKCTTFDRLSRPTGLQVAYELRKLARAV